MGVRGCVRRQLPGMAFLVTTYIRPISCMQFMCIAVQVSLRRHSGFNFLPADNFTLRVVFNLTKMYVIYLLQVPECFPNLIFIFKSLVLLSYINM